MKATTVAAAQRVAYRPMAEADLDLVADLEPTLHACPWTRGNFADALVAGYSCWVCRHAELTLGYAVMMLALDESHLLNISVRREWQRRGLGRRFLAHLQRMAKGFGAVSMYLEVRPSNLAARSLYEAEGFCLVGTRRGYYPGPDGREDALLMKRAL
jgi:[ribosomal protein S18]-alanine N-acetyltransferase